MKTNEQVRSDIIAELEKEPVIDVMSVGISFRCGVVTLSGSVDAHYKKAIVERAVRRVPEVRGIAEQIEVQPQSGGSCSDSDIVFAVLAAIELDQTIPEHCVSVTVEKGCVTLEGSVDRSSQASAAERAVQTIAGVGAVRNNICYAA